jgi:hypothetical protein
LPIITGNPEVTGMGKSSQPIGQDHGDGWYSSPSLERWKRLGEVCSSIDSHVDRTFLIEVFFISASRDFLKAVHHEQRQPKFSTNTRITKGVLCPEKSIPSIESATVR